MVWLHQQSLLIFTNASTCPYCILRIADLLGSLANFSRITFLGI